MKKTYQIEDLDCAHCAALMETGIRKISGATEVTVSFLTQKRTNTADDGQFDEIMQEVRTTGKKIDHDATNCDYPANKTHRK